MSDNKKRLASEASSILSDISEVRGSGREEATEELLSPELGQKFPYRSSVTHKMSSTKQATGNPIDEDVVKAFRTLKQAVTPYLPLVRDPGSHVFEGVDMVDHQRDDKPFKDWGIIAFAAQLIKRWEEHIGDDYKAKIEMLNPSKSAANPMSVKFATPKQLKSAAKIPQAVSQPIAHALTLPKKKAKFQKFAVVGGGMVFIKEIYLRRIELENFIYRRHLAVLEDDLAIKIAKNLRKEISDVLKEVPTPAKIVKAPQHMTTKPEKQSPVTKFKTSKSKIDKSSIDDEAPDAEKQKSTGYVKTTHPDSKRKASQAANEIKESYPAKRMKKDVKGLGSKKATTMKGSLVIDLTERGASAAPSSTDSQARETMAARLGPGCSPRERSRDTVSPSDQLRC